MKIASALVTQVSGSIGGMTGSHNKGGMYLRARSMPTNPNTPLQQAVRALMQQCNQYWRATCTATQRADWADRAANIPVVGKTGQTEYRTGMNWFVGLNVLRLQAGLAIQAAAPENNARVALGDLSIEGATAATNEFDVAWGGGDWDDNDDDSGLLVYCSRPQNASVEYFKGPYQYVGKIEGDSVSAPTSPQTFTCPFSLMEGQRIFVKVVGYSGADMHSAPFRGTCDVAA